jgi:hypothetical protein
MRKQLDRNHERIFKGQAMPTLHVQQRRVPTPFENLCRVSVGMVLMPTGGAARYAELGAGTNVGQQSLIRGLNTAFRCTVWGPLATLFGHDIRISG